MLVEDVIINIPGVELLQTNTDGATFRFNKQHLETFNYICKNWEQATRLTLEQADYKAMYIWDVNNYIAVSTSGKSKCKGRFEWEDLEKHKYTHLNKNKSHLIIPKAVYNYFVNNIMPEVYLNTNRNIFDYCGGVKSKGQWKFKELTVVKGELKTRELQKVTRYYISNSGSKIIKTHPDGREIQIESGKYMQTEFNQYVNKPWSEYNVNDDYYLKHIYAEIGAISKKKESKQTELIF